jgi:hypothetical protein
MQGGKLLDSMDEPTISVRVPFICGENSDLEGCGINDGRKHLAKGLCASCYIYPYVKAKRARDKDTLIIKE